jgi:hypothetical protein
MRLVATVASDPATRDPAILERAEAARRRYVHLLGIALKLWPDPGLERLRAQWSVPLAAGAAGRATSPASPP